MAGEVHDVIIVIEQRLLYILNSDRMPDRKLNTVAILAPSNALLQDAVFLTEPKTAGTSWVSEQSQDLHVITSPCPATVSVSRGVSALVRRRKASQMYR